MGLPYSDPTSGLIVTSSALTEAERDMNGRTLSYLLMEALPELDSTANRPISNKTSPRSSTRGAVVSVRVGQNSSDCSPRFPAPTVPSYKQRRIQRTVA